MPAATIYDFPLKALGPEDLKELDSTKQLFQELLKSLNFREDQAKSRGLPKVAEKMADMATQPIDVLENLKALYNRKFANSGDFMDALEQATAPGEVKDQDLVNRLGALFDKLERKPLKVVK